MMAKMWISEHKSVTSTLSEHLCSSLPIYIIGSMNCRWGVVEGARSLSFCTPETLLCALLLFFFFAKRIRRALLPVECYWIFSLYVFQPWPSVVQKVTRLLFLLFLWIWVMSEYLQTKLVEQVSMNPEEKKVKSFNCSWRDLDNLI